MIPGDIPVQAAVHRFPHFARVTQDLQRNATWRRQIILNVGAVAGDKQLDGRVEASPPANWEIGLVYYAQVG